MPNRRGLFDGVLPSFERTDALAIISFFTIGTLVYGIFTPFLGFYYDDWPVIWVYRALGPRGVVNYFAGERPISGWIYASLLPILGVSPIGWQVVALVVRCASSAVLFFAFCALWPSRKDTAWLVGTLVLLYPGFTQQPIAFTYLSQHLSFLLFVVSLAATIFSVTSPAYRWVFLLVSLVTAVFSYLLMEYFLGLELFRLAVIGALTNRERATREFERLRTALVMWSPYALVWAAIVAWRAFAFRAVSYYGTASYKDAGSQISRILGNPIHEVWTRVWGGIYNILMATVMAWARPFSPDFMALSSRSVVLCLTIASIVVAIAIYMLRRLTGHQNARAFGPLDDKPGSLPETSLLLGILGLGVAGLPFAVSGLRAEFSAYPSFGDRFTLPFMLASSLTLLGLTGFRSTKGPSRIGFVSVILFAFSAFQAQGASTYRRDWLSQKSLFWQLAWRAPVLKPGTSIFAEGLPRSLYRNHSAGMLNLLYNQDDSAGRLEYFIFDLSQLLIDNVSLSGAKMSYRPDDPIPGRVHSFQFEGTTAQSLVAWISPSGTFRIVTQNRANEILRSSVLCYNLSQFSQPGEVISGASGSPNGPLLKMFGSEPKHEWSYFYQKAELERQLMHWDAVAMLGDEVTNRGYSPSDVSEWFPFIDGYTRTNRYRTAADITIKVLEEEPDALVPLSSLWLRVEHDDVRKAAELSDALHLLRDKLVL